jgi:hypothetical protein
VPPACRLLVERLPGGSLAPGLMARVAIDAAAPRPPEAVHRLAVGVDR